MAEQIVDAILDGEPFELAAADGQRFLAIYTESDAPEPPRGTAIILHGRGFHPDWATVIHPLRVQLPERGWHTLSIQLPVLGTSATYYDYAPVFADAAPRIDAAVAEARSRDDGPIVIIAHSCGYHMAQHWLETGGRPAMGSIDAFVGIGMGATDFGQQMVRPFILDRLTVPVLDVFGRRDFPAVRRLAATRLEAMRAAGHPHSAQRVVAGADHYYRGREDRLVEIIAGWLDGLVDRP